MYKIYKHYLAIINNNNNQNKELKKEGKKNQNEIQKI